MESVEQIKELRDKLMTDIKEASALGVSVVPCGAYATGYNRDRLPVHAIGLIGALSLLYGENARSTMGISFEKSMAVEAGFNNMDRMKYTKLFREFYELGKSIANDVFFTDRIVKRRPRVKLPEMLFGDVEQLPMPNGLLFYHDVVQPADGPAAAPINELFVIDVEVHMGIPPAEIHPEQVQVQQPLNFQFGNNAHWLVAQEQHQNIAVEHQIPDNV